MNWIPLSFNQWHFQNNLPGPLPAVFYIAKGFYHYRKILIRRLIWFAGWKGMFDKTRHFSWHSNHSTRTDSSFYFCSPVFAEFLYGRFLWVAFSFSTRPFYFLISIRADIPAEAIVILLAAGYRDKPGIFARKLDIFFYGVVKELSCSSLF